MLQKSAALLAVALVTACGSSVSAEKPKPVARYLVYEKLTGARGVWIADVDGSHPKLLVAGGRLPSISPNGKWVAYSADCRASRLGCTYIISTSGGKPRLLTTKRLDEPITWSPNSERLGSISAFGGHAYQQPGDEDEIVIIDVESGKQATLARAPQFFGWSFSPDGKSVVFAPASRTAEGYYSEDTDLFVSAVDGAEPRRVTATGDASNPLWGPKSIAFAKYIAQENDKGHVSEIWQIQPDGTDGTRLTKSLPKRFVADRYWGLEPIDWSGDGSQLLAGLGGNWGSDPIVVDSETGATHEVGRFGRPWGVMTTALSTDGRWVLVQDGSFAQVPHEKRKVLVVPADGGRPIIAARGAWAASWTR